MKKENWEEAKSKIDNFGGGVSPSSIDYDSFLNDPLFVKETKGLSLKADDFARYLPLLSSFQEALHEEGIYRYYLKRNEGGGLEISIGPRAEILRAANLEVGFLYRDFPDEWLNRKLIRTKNIQRLLGLLKATNTEEKKRFLYLYGDDNGGKSFASAYFLMKRVENGAKAAFLETNRRFDELKSLAINDKKEFEKRMNELFEVPYLVLDNFGDEFKSDYVRDQITMPLITTRSRKNLMTIFTSNYPLEVVENLYTFNNASSFIARRLVSAVRQTLYTEEEIPSSLVSSL